MIGSFITRGLVMVLGYAYPAYECYKTVEMNKPEMEQLRFWCQYWILVSALSICERLGDAFISWIPMYSEAKVAFFVYLWYPKTRGTTYVYDSFFKPYVAKHENEIDRNLLEWKTRAGDMAVVYCQKAASYGQTRFFEVLQFLASQSTPRPRPAQVSAQNPQPQGKGTKARPQPSAPSRPAASKPDPVTEEPPSPTSSTSSSQHQEEVAEEVAGPSQSQPKPPPVTVPNSPNKRVTVASRKTTSPSPKKITASESTSEPAQKEAEPMQIEPAAPTRSESLNITPKETLMDETIRLTRGRLRKTRSTGTR